MDNIIETDQQPATDSASNTAKPAENTSNTAQPAAMGSTASTPLQAMPGSAENNQYTELNKSWNFKHLALPCAIYTAVFVFCLYKNLGAVTTPIWVASLIALVTFLIKNTGKQLKRGSIFLSAVMMIIGISCFYTANIYTLIINYAAEMMLLATLVLHNYADDSKWDIGKLFWEMIVAVFLSFGLIYTPFSDGSAFYRNRDKSRKSNTGKVLVGVLCAIPVLVVLGMLLASADAVFESVFGEIFVEFFRIVDPVRIAIMLVFGFFSAYCGMRYAGSFGPAIKCEDHRKGEQIIPATVLSLVSVMYLAFSVIQILYLFIGGFMLPHGMTYAEYARRGFFQLLFVCILNLIVVLVTKKYIVRSRFLDIILLIICACTYIMIASSAIRMVMYIRAYNLTYDRVAVLATLLTLALLLAGVIIYVIWEKFPVMRFTIVVVCVLYSVFSFANPDRVIASYNLHHLGAESNDKDLNYISTLSEDAAPAIAQYVEEQKQQGADVTTASWYLGYCEYNNINGKYTGIRTFNLSKQRANKLLGKR